jgi:hypothetical protein
MKIYFMGSSKEEGRKVRYFCLNDSTATGKFKKVNEILANLEVDENKNVNDYW